jgi:protein phosphatase 1L
MKIKIIFAVLAAFYSTASVIATQLQVAFGVVSEQNKRPYQEDKFTHVVMGESNFFGVYDGHGGDDVSSFLQQHLHQYLVGPFFTMKQACEHAFLKAEQHVLNNYTDGSTALMAFIDHNNIAHFAWAGDTRAVLEKNGAVAFATKDHKPNEAQELARIKKCGGCIEKYGVYRVGGLAVSRSVGDADIKKGYPGQVIAVPEYTKIQLTEDNQCMILASDGLWDVMSNEEAVKIARTIMQWCRNVDFIAKYLKDEAIKRGSADNITICVVRFD